MPTFVVGKLANSIHQNISNDSKKKTMEIKNKYQIGQKVFFLDVNGKAVSDTVNCVIAYIKKDSVSISYDVAKSASYLSEDKVFESETALKNHIFGSNVIDFD